MLRLYWWRIERHPHFGPRPNLYAWGHRDFNPRPPHGGRPQRDKASALPSIFQSTPPSRRATESAVLPDKDDGISIHAPLTEGDLKSFTPRRTSTLFQSTPPSRRATGGKDVVRVVGGISIHAPLTEGDQRRAQLARRDWISIHAPLTEGDPAGLAKLLQVEISIHAPLTEGDRKHLPDGSYSPISIHAPLTEGDIFLLRGHA